MSKRQVVVGDGGDSRGVRSNPYVTSDGKPNNKRRLSRRRSEDRNVNEDGGVFGDGTVKKSATAIAHAIELKEKRQQGMMSGKRSGSVAFSPDKDDSHDMMEDGDGTMMQKTPELTPPIVVKRSGSTIVFKSSSAAEDGFEQKPVQFGSQNSSPTRFNRRQTIAAYSAKVAHEMALKQREEEGTFYSHADLDARIERGVEARFLAERQRRITAFSKPTQVGEGEVRAELHRAACVQSDLGGNEIEVLKTIKESSAEENKQLKDEIESMQKKLSESKQNVMRLMANRLRSASRSVSGNNSTHADSRCPTPSGGIPAAAGEDFSAPGSRVRSAASERPPLPLSSRATPPTASTPQNQHQSTGPLAPGPTKAAQAAAAAAAAAATARIEELEQQVASKDLHIHALEEKISGMLQAYSTLSENVANLRNDWVEAKSEITETLADGIRAITEETLAPMARLQMKVNTTPLTRKVNGFREELDSLKTFVQQNLSAMNEFATAEIAKFVQNPSEKENKLIKALHDSVSRLAVSAKATSYLERAEQIQASQSAGLPQRQRWETCHLRAEKQTDQNTTFSALSWRHDATLLEIVPHVIKSLELIGKGIEGMSASKALDSVHELRVNHQAQMLNGVHAKAKQLRQHVDSLFAVSLGLDAVSVDKIAKEQDYDMGEIFKNVGGDNSIIGGTTANKFSEFGVMEETMSLMHHAQAAMTINMQILMAKGSAIISEQQQMLHEKRKSAQTVSELPATLSPPEMHIQASNAKTMEQPSTETAVEAKKETLPTLYDEADIKLEVTEIVGSPGSLSTSAKPDVAAGLLSQQQLQTSTYGGDDNFPIGANAVSMDVAQLSVHWGSVIGQLHQQGRLTGLSTGLDGGSSSVSALSPRGLGGKGGANTKNHQPLNEATLRQHNTTGAAHSHIQVHVDEDRIKEMAASTAAAHAKLAIAKRKLLRTRFHTAVRMVMLRNRLRAVAVDCSRSTRAIHQVEKVMQLKEVEEAEAAEALVRAVTAAQGPRKQLQNKLFAPSDELIAVGGHGEETVALLTAAQMNNPPQNASTSAAKNQEGGDAVVNDTLQSLRRGKVPVFGPTPPGSARRVATTSQPPSGGWSSSQKPAKPTSLSNASPRVVALHAEGEGQPTSSVGVPYGSLHPRRVPQRVLTPRQTRTETNILPPQHQQNRTGKQPSSAITARPKRKFTPTPMFSTTPVADVLAQFFAASAQQQLPEEDY